jgi:hypothetical protein
VLAETKHKASKGVGKSSKTSNPSDLCNPAYGRKPSEPPPLRWLQVLGLCVYYCRT